MAKKRERVIEKETVNPFGVTREQVEQKLQEAIESKVHYIKMLDMLDGSIQTMEFILNGLGESPDNSSEKDD